MRPRLAADVGGVEPGQPAMSSGVGDDDPESGDLFSEDRRQCARNRGNGIGSSAEPSRERPSRNPRPRNRFAERRQLYRIKPRAIARHLRQSEMRIGRGVGRVRGKCLAVVSIPEASRRECTRSPDAHLLRIFADDTVCRGAAEKNIGAAHRGGTMPLPLVRQNGAVLPLNRLVPGKKRGTGHPGRNGPLQTRSRGGAITSDVVFSADVRLERRLHWSARQGPVPGPR